MDELNFENVVLYRVGMFGVSRIDCKTLQIQTGQKYAQYDNAIRYQYMQKGKRKPAAFVLAESSPWLRVTEAENAPNPANGMESTVGGSRSRYTSLDMRYVTEFEDTLATSGAVVVFEVGAGHRGDCGCGLCAGRMREAREVVNG